MTAVVTCARCGVQILPLTATRTGGLCMPCSTGTREAIEQGREWNQRERDHRDSPRGRYWANLVHRVHDSPDGFKSLSESEQLYFAGCVFDGEVYNGGLQQFFFNSSGDHYAHVMMCLASVGAHQCLALLEQAKRALFPDRDVPPDTGERRRLLRVTLTPEVAQHLDRLDDVYYSDPDTLGSRLDAFALERQLF